MRIMEDRDFDKFIKEGLEQDSLTNTYSSEWDKMEGLLGVDEFVADEAFDQFVKEKLQHDNLTHSYSSDWSKMEGLLNMDELVADEIFDQFVKKGVAYHSSSVHSGNWGDMEILLDKDERERKELIYIKSIEFALVLLAIITLFQFYPDANPEPRNPFQSANPVTSIQKNNEGVETELHLAFDENTVDANVEKITNGGVSEESYTNTPKKNERGGAIYSASDYVSGVAELPNPAINNLLDDKVDNNILDTPVRTPIVNNGSVIVPKTNSEVIMSNIPVPFAKERGNIIDGGYAKEKEVERSSELAEVEALNSDKLEAGKPDVKVPITVLKPQFRTSYHVGIDRNHILTPYNTESKSSFRQADYGFSTGAKISLQKNKWEFETGLSYIRKTYRPQPVFEITGSSLDGYEAETLKKLTFNTVSIPLDIRFYTLDMSNRWNFYIMTGANFNTVAWSNYGRYTYDISNGTASNRPLKDIDNQKAGIFFGESLKDNFYMTASLGLGMEVNINEKASFFTQPKYTYYLLPGNVGLGPNNDQFNTLSVDLGLRFKM